MPTVETFPIDPNRILEVQDANVVANDEATGRRDYAKQDRLTIRANSSAGTPVIELLAKNDNEADVGLTLTPKGSGKLTLTGVETLSISLAATASGENGLLVSDTFTLATAGVHKAIQGDVTYTPATTGFATPIGVAGKATLNGDFTGGVGYMWGMQGQLHFADAAVINNAHSIFSGLRGVITADATPTFTAGIVCGLYVDNLVTYDMSASSEEVSLVRLANHGDGTSRSTIDSAVSLYGVKVTNLLHLESCIGGGGCVSAFGGSAHGGTIKKIAIEVDGVTSYLLASTAPA